MRPLSQVSLSRVRRLLPFLAGFRSKLAIIFLLSFSNTILGLLQPIFTKILIDDVLLPRNLRLLWILSGIMIAVTLVSYVLGAFNRYYYTNVTARVLFNLRQHLFEHLQALPMRFHVRAKVGDLLSRLNSDIAEVQSMLTDTGFSFIANVFTLFAATGFLLWLNWKLFLLSLTLVPLQLYGVMKFRPLIVNQTRAVRELNACDFVLPGGVAVGDKVYQAFRCGKNPARPAFRAGRRLRQSRHAARDAVIPRRQRLDLQHRSRLRAGDALRRIPSDRAPDDDWRAGGILGLPGARVQSVAGADRSLPAGAARGRIGGSHLRVPGPSDRERRRDGKRPAARGSRRDRVSPRFIQP